VQFPRLAQTPTPTLASGPVRPAARLDKGTKLVGQESQVGWSVSAFPQCGEAVFSFAASYQSPEYGSTGSYGDPDANRLRAERRARTMLRRYCVANKIDRLASLTFGPPFCTDPAELRQHMARFVRRLRCELGHSFAYVWVPELHKDGVKLHAHMGFAEYIAKDRLARVWGHGFVDIRLMRARGSKNPLDHQRRTAGYLSKYLGKAFDQPGTFGCHRYEVGQGFQPQREQRTFATEAEARAWASTLMGGGTPSYIWHSSDVDDWKGPPVDVAYWDEIA
jgi:hypothetical protein